MSAPYALEWFNQLLSLTLNPEPSNLKNLNGEQLHQIRETLRQQSNQLQLSLKSRIFSVCSPDEASAVISNHYQALTVLIDEAYELRSQLPARSPELRRFCTELLSCLAAALQFLESHFSGYLQQKTLVPVALLASFQKEFRQELVLLELRFSKYPYPQQEGRVVVKVLRDFTNRLSASLAVTAHDLRYKKELLVKLDAFRPSPGQPPVFHELDVLLIYMNFNSKAYIDDLTQRIRAAVAALGTEAERLTRLLYYRKEFGQMHHKRGVALNPGYLSLRKLLGKWFSEELKYLQQTGPDVKPKASNPEKVQIALSVDQISLLLRAASEEKIILTKSLNSLFRTAVPHLATVHRQDLSADSMRSKAYVAEPSDKAAVVRALELMITRVRGY